MNKQAKWINGVLVGRGIEWTDFTSNPMRGCLQGCEWLMPNGTYANCYAEDVAEGIASKAYPEGFEHYYWGERELKLWKNIPAGSKVFVGSMADSFGHWVPTEDIQQVIDAARELPEVTFQFLTKNPKRMLDFTFPQNAWLGASTPPSRFWHKNLSEHKREELMNKTADTLYELDRRGNVTWMSAEPLNIALDRWMERLPRFIRWLVVGAASNGKTYYPPNEAMVQATVAQADRLGVRLFFKGNLKILPWAAQHWREEFPT